MAAHSVTRWVENSVDDSAGRSASLMVAAKAEQKAVSWGLTMVEWKVGHLAALSVCCWAV